MVLEILGIEPATPGLIPYFFVHKVWLFLGRNKYRGRLYYLYVYFTTGHPKAQPKVVLKKQQLFVAFPWVETSTGPRGFMICVFII